MRLAFKEGGRGRGSAGQKTAETGRFNPTPEVERLGLETASNRITKPFQLVGGRLSNKHAKLLNISMFAS